MFTERDPNLAPATAGLVAELEQRDVRREDQELGWELCEVRVQPISRVGVEGKSDYRYRPLHQLREQRVVFGSSRRIQWHRQP